MTTLPGLKMTEPVPLSSGGCGGTQPDSGSSIAPSTLLYSSLMNCEGPGSGCPTLPHPPSSTNLQVAQLLWSSVGGPDIHKYYVAPLCRKEGGNNPYLAEGPQADRLFQA